MTIIHGEPYLCIRRIDTMPPFLMSVVSNSNFWLFAGSNSGFTAGRVDPDHAVFPYNTADKILSQPKASGVLSHIIVNGSHWEPWAASTPAPGITRNLYKHIAGTSVIFEEIHQTLGLAFRWELTVSARFGLVRSCRLENLTDQAREIRILDGWHHLLPSGVTQETYSRYSYLASAYMRHEADPGCALGIYTLNSGITDRAEPCESLRASCAWSLGLDEAIMLLSDSQVDSFRRGLEQSPENEARGVFGAHLLSARLDIPARGSRDWFIVADTELDHTGLLRLRHKLMKPDALLSEIKADLASGVLALRKRIAGAGAIQQTADSRAGIHHFANVLFNCMRGGTLHDNYRFPRSDFKAFLETRNREVLNRNHDWLSSLPDPCTLETLNNLARKRGDNQLSRLAGEYLPLCFSRRHGDPSRPWNRFEIHTEDSNGMPHFTYAGNWRDIFQNWESLAMSYPSCFEPMINIFLNATTADGYNPYRITRSGIDWEVLDPEDPWSHIGYWGDHQIIYLLRLLEGQERHMPGLLTARLNQRSHSYANVPYEIGGFEDLRRDPKHSIIFNEKLHRQLMERAAILGGDGKLLAGHDGEVVLVSLAEKLLVPLLAKLTNLVPGGGVWLNTQRPEWNDANNALAGWGLSVVTVCHMRRYLVFLDTIFDARAPSSLELSKPVAELLESLVEILSKPGAADPGDAKRHDIMKSLGLAGEAHRRQVYGRRAEETISVGLPSIRRFIATALSAVDATLRVNRRDDQLFHSYNLLEIHGDKATIRRLDLMLEGQVAALSSGALNPAATLRLLVGLRESPLHREDQNSYLLYPDRTITPFLERNTLPAGWETRIPRLAEIIQAGNRDVIRIDDNGRAHFHPDLTNSRSLIDRLDLISALPGGREAVQSDREGMLELWEQVFKHRSFTGRSGAMFGFEGLGSIYWHMVAKLLLAVQETHHQACRESPDSSDTLLLAQAYEEIRNGLGFTKNPETYGAFPTDPYSHSPRHQGAQQPGMTGQVKEEILTRMGELGVHVEDGRIRFAPVLLKPREFFQSPHEFSYIDIDGETRVWNLGPGTLAFTAFQVPVCYQLGARHAITLENRDGVSTRITDTLLPVAESRSLFERDGSIRSITVIIPKSQLSPHTSP